MDLIFYELDEIFYMVSEYVIVRAHILANPGVEVVAHKLEIERKMPFSWLVVDLSCGTRGK